MKKSLVEIELTIEMWDFETRKLKNIIKIAKIKTKKLEYTEYNLTQIVIKK